MEIKHLLDLDMRKWFRGAARKQAPGFRCENASPLIERVVVFLQVSQSMTCLERLISAIIPQLH